MFARTIGDIPCPWKANRAQFGHRRRKRVELHDSVRRSSHGLQHIWRGSRPVQQGDQVFLGVVRWADHLGAERAVPRACCSRAWWHVGARRRIVARSGAHVNKHTENRYREILATQIFSVLVPSVSLGSRVKRSRISFAASAV